MRKPKIKNKSYEVTATGNPYARIVRAVNEEYAVNMYYRDVYGLDDWMPPLSNDDGVWVIMSNSNNLALTVTIKEI